MALRILLLCAVTGPATAATHTVQIHHGFFDPSSLTIQQGDTVTWVWAAAGHSTTSNGGQAESWDSGVINQVGFEFSHTFQTPGSYGYVCTPHAPFMQGSVTVQATPKMNTTTSLESSQNPSGVGASVTFTATVSADEGLPTGTVTFFNGTSAMCTNVTLSSASAACNRSDLTVGTHSITAAYSGDAMFNPSTSSALMQTVDGPPAVPMGLTASATSASEVMVSWSAVSGASMYEVFRSSMNNPYGPLTVTSSASLMDTGLFANTTYLYKVRAIGAGGPSDFSAADAATTIVFTDTNLFGATVKAIHISELRTAVNAMRAAAGLPAASFTDHPLEPGLMVQRQHVIQLRTALDQARSALMLSALIYTDAELTAGVTLIRAQHPAELRAGTQ